MPEPFRTLAKAILDDDRIRAEELLRQDAALATATASEARLEKDLPHWIYAGDSALHIAAAGHRVKTVKMLLQFGADYAAANNHRHSQPLHYAADGCPDRSSWNARRQVRTIEVLIQAGADVHARDKNGATPLHRAVRTRCAEAVKFLLDAGADATLQNKPGSTPFHLAVQNTGRGGSGAAQARSAQRQIIEIFLGHGISPKLKDARGKSVLDWTESEWIRQILTGKPEAH